MQPCIKIEHMCPGPVELMILHGAADHPINDEEAVTSQSGLTSVNEDDSVGRPQVNTYEFCMLFELKGCEALILFN